MTRHLKSALIALTLFLILTSCAKDQSISALTLQKNVRDAWLRINYPSVEADELGLYVLEDTPGSGAQPTDSSYVFLEVSTKYLDGTYSGTSRVDLSKKLGLYNDSSHYVPYIFHLGNYEMYDVLEGELTKRNVGGKFTVLIPPEQTVISYPTEYLKMYGLTNGIISNVNEIYEVEVVESTDNISEYQIHLLEDYGMSHYSEHFPHGVDSLAYGFYFCFLKMNQDQSDTIPQGTVIGVDYIGKFLDDFCFDTSIADSAKFYRLFDPNAEYAPLDVSYYSEYSSIVNASSVVAGFAKLISLMKYDEEAVAFFTSDWGYRETGGGSIPGYTPLAFYIKTPENTDTTTE